MAKSQETFNKKERAKKKLQKRKEKEQRREEKKQEPSGRGKQFDDMIAYVDENGNLSSTPPDPKKAKEVALEDIVIDIPRAAPADPDALPTGVVSYFDTSKGYGFITNSTSQERIFVHVKSLADPEVTLAAGDKVEYTATKGPRGWQAESVRKL
ncbi:cold shock domain-containing protein [Parapedobacter koreensis]|uniref:Cold-shock DNA-binding protein family n=1 Tax=Parapedobacter koreensis TaxID=332977 RepID=A0A1H7FLF8_9SPHI|nr:cold shock domain-containing protein [Parapedobacter koreensis]SEK26087.1 cold-shock DNA-binding protein family [Parapedobacter koreensis]